MKRHGFSLFEMIVVLGIMSVVTSIGATIFIQMSDNWKGVRRTAELETRAEVVFDAIRRDAENLLAPRITGVGVQSDVPEFRNPREYDAEGLEDGKLLMPVYAAIGPGQTVTAAKVQYRIDRSQPLPTLVRSVGGLYDEDPRGNTLTIAEGVYAFAIDYPGQEDAATGPRLMRISILLADETRPNDQIARTAVVPLRVE